MKLVGVVCVSMCQIKYLESLHQFALNTFLLFFTIHSVTYLLIFIFIFRQYYLHTVWFISCYYPGCRKRPSISDSLVALTDIISSNWPYLQTVWCSIRHDRTLNDFWGKMTRIWHFPRKVCQSLFDSVCQKSNRLI